MSKSEVIANGVGMKNLLSDGKYENGFGVMGMSAESGRKNLAFFACGGKPEAEPVWQIGQWSGKNDLCRSKGRETAPGVWNYTAGGKSFTLDRNDNVLTLAVNAEKEYDHARRENEGWVHLLLEQEFSEWARVEGAKSVCAELDFSVDKCVNRMGREYDPELHAAQLTWYIMVTNRPKKTVYDEKTGLWSEGEDGDYLWFGLPIFDNRRPYAEKSAAYDRGTDRYISSIASYRYLSRDAEVGKRYAFRYDILPDIRDAVCRAKELGALKNVRYENLYFTYMNFGWEVPGIFDVSLSVRSINLYWN